MKCNARIKLKLRRDAKCSKVQQDESITTLLVKLCYLDYLKKKAKLYATSLNAMRMKMSNERM